MNTCSVPPLTSGRLALPLLLCASMGAPANAAPDEALLAPSEPAGAVGEKAKLDAVWALRREARALAERGLRVAAASRWRQVLHLLRQMEGASRGARLSSAEKALRAEAESEVRRVQSDLSALWQVDDVVTLAADSRNASPAESEAAAAPKAAVADARAMGERASSLDQTERFVSTRSLERVEKPAQVLASSAPSVFPRLAPVGPAGVRSSAVLRGAPGVAAVAARAPRRLATFDSRAPRNQGGSAPAARLVTRVVVKPQPLRAERVSARSVGPAERKAHAAREVAALDWARSQWWARPLVVRGVDSRNAALSEPQRERPADLSPSWASAALGPARILTAQTPQAPLPARWAEPAAAPRVVASGAASEALAPTERVQTVVVERPRPVRGRSWTMQLRLPSAREAAGAARALGSQP